MKGDHDPQIGQISWINQKNGLGIGRKSPFLILITDSCLLDSFFRSSNLPLFISISDSWPLVPFFPFTRHSSRVTLHGSCEPLLPLTLQPPSSGWGRPWTSSPTLFSGLSAIAASCCWGRSRNWGRSPEMLPVRPLEFDSAVFARAGHRFSRGDGFIPDPVAGVALLT
jgi:hypothetical protein